MNIINQHDRLAADPPRALSLGDGWWLLGAVAVVVAGIAVVEVLR